MHRLVKSWMAVLLLVSLVPAGAAEKRERKITMHVSGLFCSGCARKIEKGLSSVSGVDSVHVNVVKGAVEVLGDPRAMKVDDLGRVIRQAGYRVRSIDTAGAAEMR